MSFNIDVKPQNNPRRLFTLMHNIISAQPEWETKLAPRLVLGLWHPSFLAAAKENVPYLSRSFIGVSPYLARTYFWNDCDFFSMSFGVLATADGERYVLHASWVEIDTIFIFLDSGRSVKMQERS